MPRRENVRCEILSLKTLGKKKMKPVQETDNCPGTRRIADIDLIIKQLQEGCKNCLLGPIMLPDSDLSDVNHPNSLMVICQNCRPLIVELLIVELGLSDLGEIRILSGTWNSHFEIECVEFRWSQIFVAPSENEWPQQ